MVLILLVGLQGIAVVAASTTDEDATAAPTPTLFINRGSAVIALSLKNGAQWQVTQPGQRIERADVSPDGSMIVFHDGGPSRPGHIYLSNTDGTELRQVTDEPSQLSEVFFDLTGEHVYFDENMSLGFESRVIVSINVETGERREHTSIDVDAELIGARQGRIAYFETVGDTRMMVVLDAATGNEIARHQARSFDRTHHWALQQGSIDDAGDQMMFATGDGLGVLSLTGATPTFTLLETTPVLWPRLSPDGRWAAYSVDTGGHEELTLVDLQNVTEKRVLASNNRVINPGWTPDSTGLVFAVQGSTGLSSVHIDLNGQETPLGIDGIPFRIREIADQPVPEESDATEDESIGSAAIETEPALDTDGDGRPDSVDLDDDDDGHLDDQDAFPLNRYEHSDSDGDGIGDRAERDAARRASDFIREAEGSGLNDADGDGQWDPDSDEDADGYHDLIDPSPTLPPKTACWTGGNDELVPFPGEPSGDWDGDGEPNSTDQDLDNNGTVEDWELTELQWSGGQEDQDGDGIIDAEDRDVDGDGVANADDQFPLDGSEWVDFDCGGLGDNADPDDDDDGVFEAADDTRPGERVDPFPLNDHEWADNDGDGIGDNLDADDDNDGTLDSLDYFPFDPNETIDSDFDTIGDNADTDDDNDGVDDVDDAFPLDPLYTRDSDGDGEGDLSELRENNPILFEAIDETLGYRDPITGLPTVPGQRVVSSPTSSGGTEIPWRIIIRIFIVWPLLYLGYRARREDA